MLGEGGQRGAVSASQRRGWVGVRSWGLSPGAAGTHAAGSPLHQPRGAGDGVSVFCSPRALVPDPALPSALPGVYSLPPGWQWALPCQGIFLPTLPLPSTENVQEHYIFLVSLLQAWIFYSPCLFCHAREESCSLACSYTCVFNALGVPWSFPEPPDSADIPQAPVLGYSRKSHSC